jgi:Uma2 family endonuclease
MPADPARKYATYADVLAQPEHVVAEVVHGTLHTLPRPRVRHARAASALGGDLTAPFEHGRGGPGGWVILDEPELHLGAEPAIVVPDLAGWRRERMPELPDAAFLTLAPDWVCEVLSPSTADFDRADKVPLYASERVGHVWLVDPDVRTLEVLRLDGSGYRLAHTWRGDAVVRAEPFDAIELAMAHLWAR